MVAVTTFSLCDSQHLSLSALNFTWVTDFLLISFSTFHASTYLGFCLLPSFYLLLPFLFSLVSYVSYIHFLERGFDKVTLWLFTIVWSSAEEFLCLFAPGYWQVYSTWLCLIQVGIHGPTSTVQDGKGLRMLPENAVYTELFWTVRRSLWGEQHLEFHDFTPVHSFFSIIAMLFTDGEIQKVKNVQWSCLIT